MPEHTPAPTAARSLYGFFLYLFSKTILGIYCAWAFIPDHYLHYLNIYYYPQKYWSTAVPIQCLVALTIFAFLIYPSTNLMLTTNIDSIHTICDSHSQWVHEIVDNNNENSFVCVCSDKMKCMKHIYHPSTMDVIQNTVPQLHELDVRFVSKKIYFK